VGVNAGSRATQDLLYYNKGAEMWARMRDWLDAGADIPDDPELGEQLTAREYDYTIKEQLRLERKEDMAARGVGSPDRADSLALTFAELVHFGGANNQSFEPDFEA
jgi:hypothetical protein